MECSLLSVIKRIFSNWSSFKIAVDLTGNKREACEVFDIVNTFCIETAKCSEDIEDKLDDLMDERFDMIFEDDNETLEVGELLYKFVILFKENKLQECVQEMEKLPPTNQTWLDGIEGTLRKGSSRERNTQENQDSDSESDSSSDDMDMEVEEEPGWTTVTNKKRK